MGEKKAMFLSSLDSYAARLASMASRSYLIQKVPGSGMKQFFSTGGKVIMGGRTVDHRPLTWVGSMSGWTLSAFTNIRAYLAYPSASTHWSRASMTWDFIPLVFQARRLSSWLSREGALVR